MVGTKEFLETANFKVAIILTQEKPEQKEQEFLMRFVNTGCGGLLSPFYLSLHKSTTTLFFALTHVPLCCGSFFADVFDGSNLRMCALQAIPLAQIQLVLDCLHWWFIGGIGYTMSGAFT
jgi:hypothetical protein